MTKKHIKVAAAIIVDNKNVLIACRKTGRLAGLWEFPGGKIEKNETPQQCLVREIKEELDLEIMVGDFFGKSLYTEQDLFVILCAYFCKCVVTTDIALNVHSDVKWVDLHCIDSYQFAPADISFVRKLQLVGF